MKKEKQKERILHVGPGVIRQALDKNHIFKAKNSVISYISIGGHFGSSYVCESSLLAVH